MKSDATRSILDKFHCLIVLSGVRWRDERGRAVLDLLHHDPNRTNKWWTNRTLCEYRGETKGWGMSRREGRRNTKFI